MPSFELEGGRAGNDDGAMFDDHSLETMDPGMFMTPVEQAIAIV